MKFRTKFERRSVVSPAGGISMTDQQYKDECSIDGIIRRYGVIPPSTVIPVAKEVDVSSCGDFAQVMQRVIDARDKFSALPAEVRARFGHDVEAFYAWISDKSNLDEAIKLGLVEVSPDRRDVGDILEEIAANTTRDSVTPVKAE